MFFAVLIDYSLVLIDYTVLLCGYQFLKLSALIDYHTFFFLCYGLRFSIVIDYCIILIDYMFGLKLFLVLSSFVIDYYLVLIDYMVWFMASFGFVFYFNWLPYVLIDYKGLMGSFLGIFNQLHLRFNRLLIPTFDFGWKQGSI